MDGHQERMGASTNSWQKEMMACQKATEVCLEKAKANPEKIKAGLEEMETAGFVYKERLNKMDTVDLEANREKLEAVVEHREAPKEEATVETFGALKKRYGDRHIAI
jgi:hypothetical protein